MSKTILKVPHLLSRKEAVKKIQELLFDLQKEFKDQITEFKEEWDTKCGEFSFLANKISVFGTFTITPSLVILKLVDDSKFSEHLFEFFRIKIDSLFNEKEKEKELL